MAVPGLPALPGASRSGSGTQVVLRGADSWLGLRFVFFPDPSSSGDEVFGGRQCCDFIASPPLGYLGVKLAHLLRQMLTVQTPKKF